MRNVTMIGVALLLLMTMAFASSTAAWYNDTPTNDTCVTLYSDKGLYEYTKDNIVSGKVLIENKCGIAIEAKYLEFYDSSPIQPDLRVSAVSEVAVKINPKEPITSKPKEITKDFNTYIAVLVNPEEVTEKDGQFIFNSKETGKEYLITKEQFDQAKMVDDKNGQTYPVWVEDVRTETKTITMYATQRIPLEKIPEGETVIPFNFTTTSREGEFGFNIEGISFLDPAYAPYNTGFVADWNFDGTGPLLTDVNTDTNHTATINGSYIDSQTNAKMGKSYRFNTTYASVLDSTGVFKSTHFSASMWFQTKSTGTVALMSSMANRTVSQAAGWVVDMGVSGVGVIEWRMGSVDGAATETTMVLPGTYNDGAWHHLVITYDGAAKRMWLDGNLTGTPQTAGLAYNATNYVFIGGSRINGVSNWGFDGNFDEFAFWDRNLTTTEINNLWNSGNGFPYPFTNAYSKTFNVYRTGQSTNLTHVDMDCNVNAYDRNNQTSPFSVDMNLGTYTCGFLVQNGYDRNTVTVVVTTSDVTTIYLNDTIAPTVSITATAGSFTQWNNIDGQFTLSATDKNGSGIALTQYRLDNGTWTTYSGAVNITTDLNHIIDYNTVDNAGNTSGITRIYYALDKTAPTVGATTINSFQTYLTYIKGTGNIIGGTVVDMGSGINTASCDYTSNNGASWNSASFNTDHCEVIGFSINNSIVYRFNTRIRDNATNTGTGTATSSYTGDTVGPVVSDNSVPNYTSNPTITISAVDVGSGVKRVWYCVDNANTCTPDIVGISVGLTCPDGFICTNYIRYVGMDNLDTNSAITSTGILTIDRTAPITYPVNEGNKWTLLDLLNIGAGNLFGFDYTMLGIFGLIGFAIVAFIFRINSLVAIIISVPITFSFLMLAGGASFILSTLLVLEIIAIAAKVGISLLGIGNSGGG